MTKSIEEHNRDTDLKELTKHHRTQALDWTKGKTDAELLEVIVEQRTYVDDIMREAEEKALSHKSWDSAVTDELLRRMAESGVKSFKIDEIGIATITPRRNFSINDPQMLYDHVVATKSIAIFGASLKKAEVEAYEKEHEKLPDGITAHTVNTIRITRK